jgi:hypothetical protein
MPGQVLIMDMTGMTDPSEVQAMVVSFIWQVKQPRYWDPPALVRFSQAADVQYRRIARAFGVAIDAVKVYRANMKIISE